MAQASIFFVFFFTINQHIQKSVLELHGIDYIQLENVKKIDLSLDQVLKNNIALSYFIDFVSSQGKQTDLFFYLNIEGRCKCSPRYY